MRILDDSDAQSFEINLYETLMFIYMQKRYCKDILKNCYSVLFGHPLPRTTKMIISI